MSGNLSGGGNGTWWLGLGVGLSGASAASTGPLITWAREHRAAIVLGAVIISGPGGPETAVGSIGLEPMDTGWRISTGGADVPEDFAPGKYTLRLTPDIETAERSMDDERIFGDELVMEIQVTSSLVTPAAGPAATKR